MFPCEDSKTVSVCPSVCLSICPYPEKRNHHSYVKISPTLVIDTSMERPSRVLHHGNPKIWFFFQKSSKFEFWLSTKSWNHHGFVNISPTLVIDASMEWSSRVLHHRNPKNVIFFFFKKFEIDEIDFCPYPEFPYAEKKKLPWLCQYLSYVSNWYVNGKVFTSTTTWETNFFFSKKFEIEFDLCWRAEINIQVGLTYMSTLGMHRRPFEGRHLVNYVSIPAYLHVVLRTLVDALSRTTMTTLCCCYLYVFPYGKIIWIYRLNSMHSRKFSTNNLIMVIWCTVCIWVTTTKRRRLSLVNLSCP